MKAADALSSRPSVDGSLSEVRESDIHSLDTLSHSRSKKQGLNEDELFQMACELSDQGFGEFDLCLTVLTAKKGNSALAKNALSKLIFSKQKNSKSFKKPQDER